MTLGQVALAVGATPRWVLNALTRLKVPRRYGEPLARRLALARVLHQSLELELPRAWRRAGRILAEADLHQPWTEPSGDGLVTVTVDLPRVMTMYAVRLALARSTYGERRRGRRDRRRRSAIQRAADWGMDTTLVTASLAESPAARVRELDLNREAFERMRGPVADRE